MIAVLFEAEPADGQLDNYLKFAKNLRPLLDNIDGFISIERFTSLSNDGKILSLSFWRDEHAIKQWRHVEKHKIAQDQARAHIFKSYRLRICNIVRDYDMDHRDQAPKD